MSYSDDQVAAYVDGELDDITAAKITRDAENDPELAGRIAAEQSLRATLGAHFDPMLEEAVPDRLTAMLTNVDSSFSDRLAEKQDAKQTRPTGFQFQQWGALAASLVVGIVIGNMAFSQPEGLVASGAAGVVAAGDLEQALETQLASSQTGDETVQIRLTFTDQTGSTCRSFEEATISGIACKQGGQWQVRRSFEGVAQSEFRQASSTALLEAVSEMMAGDAFDADREQSARQSGWSN